MTRCCHILAVQYRSKGGYDMPTENSYLSDIEEILLHRHDNGGDYWATPDKRLLKGAPFTTIESPLYLLELGVSADDPIMKETANLIFSTSFTIWVRFQKVIHSHNGNKKNRCFGG